MIIIYLYGRVRAYVAYGGRLNGFITFPAPSLRACLPPQSYLFFICYSASCSRSLSLSLWPFLRGSFCFTFFDIPKLLTISPPQPPNPVSFLLLLFFHFVVVLLCFSKKKKNTFVIQIL